MSMSSRDRNLAPPGRSPEEISDVIDEGPLPGPPPAGEAGPEAPEPIEPADPLLSEPLGALVPNDPISANRPGQSSSEPPHDPSHTGNQPSQPASAANAPEVPQVPTLEPPITQ